MAVNLERSARKTAIVTSVKQKDPMRLLRPGACVWLTVHTPREADKKGDIRKSQILERSGERIAVGQPEVPVGDDVLGSVICISWLELLADGKITRRMMDAELYKITEFRKGGLVRQALWFDRPMRVYSGSLRRGYRVAVPDAARAEAGIMDPGKRTLGLRIRYPLVDLSTSGLRFACEKESRTDKGVLPDPIAELKVGQSIRLRLSIEGRILMTVLAAVRTKLYPAGRDANSVHFGVEFMETVLIDDSGNETQRPYGETDSRVLAPYISRFQRMNLKKDSGV